MCVLHEDTFLEYFKPYRHPKAHFDILSGIGLEAFGDDFEIVRQLRPEYLWKIVDGDCGDDQWIKPGVRYVNRVCYLVSRKPQQILNRDV